jgi:hypothetical protein
MTGPTLPQPLETATLAAASRCRQIVSVMQLKYKRHGYVNTVILGIGMDQERVVAFRSYHSSSPPTSSHTTMITELPLQWHGMWHVDAAGTIGAVFHCKADMDKAGHHRFVPVCDGIMKFTDPFDMSDLLVEVEEIVAENFDAAEIDLEIVAENFDAAEIDLEIVAENDKVIVAEIVDSAEIVVKIDEKIVAKIVDSAVSEWTLATHDL